MQVAALLRNDGLDRSSRDRDDPKGDVAALVRHEGDAPAVRGPARPRLVALAVRQLERVAAGGGREPELVALASEVRAVDDAAAVARPVGMGLPVGLLLP